MNLDEIEELICKLAFVEGIDEIFNLFIGPHNELAKGYQVYVASEIINDSNCQRIIEIVENQELKYIWTKWRGYSYMMIYTPKN